MVAIGVYIVLFISLLVVLHYKFKLIGNGTYYTVGYAIVFTLIIPDLNIFFELAGSLTFPYYIIGWLLVLGLSIFIVSKIVGGMLIMITETWRETTDLIPMKNKIPSITSVQIQKLIGGKK